MSVSFKDFYLLVDAVDETLDEGKIWDAIKKKLGGDSASDADVAAEVERVKGIDSSDLEKIKKTKASREFKLRQAQRAKEKNSQDQQARSAFNNPNASMAARTAELRTKLDAKPTANLRGAEARAAERNWVQEGQDLTEGLCDFKVTYTDPAGKKKITTMRGRDVREVRRKFGDQFYRMKITSVEPMKAKPKAKPTDIEDDNDE